MTIISKDTAGALIPQDESNEIIKAVTQTSVVLKLGRRLSNMSAGTRRISVMSAMPMAYFVDGTPSAPPANTVGFKQATSAEWEGLFIHAEEIACIAPIPQSVLDDASYDIWTEIKPNIVEAFGQVIDAAVLYGTNKPASWRAGIIPDAIAKGNTRTKSADLYADIMAKDGALGLVEADGYFPTGHVSPMSFRGDLRMLRDNQNQPVFLSNMKERTDYSLDGLPLEFSPVMDEKTHLLTGDFSKLVYAFRTDITYKVLTEAVIQDPETKAIVYNLAQQDMVALRCYARLGWQLPRPVTRYNETADRFPFAVLRTTP